MAPPLRAVITDLDGTLYSQGPVRRYVTIRLLRYALVHPLSAWKTMRALSAYRRSQEELREDGEPGAAWRQSAHAARQSGCTEEFVVESVERWMHTVPLPSLARARRPGLVEFLDWASGAGLLLAVVSDYDAHAKLRALGVERYFPVVVCACDEEVGIFKPSPVALRVAARRLGVQPEEAIYVGDRPEVDSAAAAAAGMLGVIIGAPKVETWFDLRGFIELKGYA